MGNEEKTKKCIIAVSCCIFAHQLPCFLVSLNKRYEIKKLSLGFSPGDHCSEAVLQVSFIPLCFCEWSLTLIRSFVIHFLFLKKHLLLIIFLYLLVHVYRHRYQWKPKEDTRSTGDALQVDVGTTWCPCWVSSSGPPQEQCILLIYPGLTYCNSPCSGYNSALLQTLSLLLPPFRVVPSLALLTTLIALGCGIFLSLCLSVWKTSSSRALSLGMPLSPRHLWFW